MTDPTATPDPAAIERDIRQTQDEMSKTVDRIGDQLTPRNILNALLDQAESNNIDARWLLDGARHNPLALAMIAGGAIWLVSDQDAKLPTFKSYRLQNFDSDQDHHDYITHMDRVEIRDGEDPLAYQRRRDIARSNYFMIERGHDEDEPSFRQRLDDAAEKFRARRRIWSEQTRRAGSSVAETGRGAVDRTREMYDTSPLVGGLIAAAAGAFLGGMLPLTQFEQEKLSAVGEKTRELAEEQKDKLVGAAREQKDQLVTAAEDKVKPPAEMSGSDQAPAIGGLGAPV